MKLTLVAPLAVAMAATSAQAAEVAVFPVRVTNLSPAQADAIGEILTAQYAKVSGKDVLSPANARAALNDRNDLAGAAQALKVSEYIEASAVSLDTKVLVTASRRASDGHEIYRAQMTGASLDDMVEVADRLARALTEKTPPEDTLNLDNITKAESRPKNRVRANKTLGIKTSLGFPLPTSDFEQFLTLGFDGRFELQSCFLEVGAGVMIPASSSDKRGYGGLYAEFGGSYYLYNSSILSPYIGAGVIPRIIWSSAGGNINLAPYAQAGVMLFRFSTVRLYTDVRAAVNVLPIKTRGAFDEYNYDYRTENRRPVEVVWQVGMGW